VVFCYSLLYDRSIFFRRIFRFHFIRISDDAEKNIQQMEGVPKGNVNKSKCSYLIMLAVHPYIRDGLLDQVTFTTR
jgi:hypothetical protein